MMLLIKMIGTNRQILSVPNNWSSMHSHFAISQLFLAVQALQKKIAISCQQSILNSSYRSDN